MSGMYDEAPSPSVVLAPLPDNTSFTGARATDPAAYLSAAEQRSREFQVSIETVKILRRDVIHCYRKEGVNHLQNCRVQVDKYVAAISDPLLLDIKGKNKAVAAAKGGD